MSEKDNGGTAFPVDDFCRDEGMTLRAYFTAKAMQGFAAAPDMAGTPVSHVAQQAYELADAMLKAGGK